MKTSRWFFVVWMCLVTSISLARDLPDPVRTPGATNPDVTQDTIHQTICVSKWTDIIRPPTSYTNDLKRTQIKEYNYKDKNPASYEEDHLISLQLGGHPTDAQNLWPEPYNTRCGARIKDVVETRLKRMVCAGKISLANAQKAIATNWIAAYKTYVNGEGCPPLELEQ